MKKTKIVCTIGPSSRNEKILQKLISSGMDIVRINTSHSGKQEILEIAEIVRRISKEYGKNTAIMLDLQGLKIRIGKLEKEIIVEDGEKIILTTDEKYKVDRANTGDGIKEVIRVDYDKFIEDIHVGAVIFIDDGLIECRVLEIKKSKKVSICKVVRGGVLKSHKGINLPGISVNADSITRKDLNFLNFGLDIRVDFIAQSFVRNGGDIKKIKEIIEDRGSNAMVIAKIEKHEAVDNFDDILKYTDAIMIARGDLGIEVKAEDVPSIQKTIIMKSNMVGKPVITATQMLDSMIRNPRPTRAEVSDVANAILDGSDAVMLSGETAIGKYPVESLEMMVKIIKKTEKVLDYNAIMRNNAILRKKFNIAQNTITEAISFSSCEVANALGAKAILSSTQSGHTARQISKNRPKSIIIGASPHGWVVRQLMLSWGVIPAKTEFTENINNMIEKTIEVSKKLNYINAGDTVVITGGIMTHKPGSTNFINVRKVE